MEQINEKEKIENKSITKALNPSIVNGITVYDGILQFGTMFDYENFIEYFSPEQDGFNDSLFSECMDYLDELNFTSLYDYIISSFDRQAFFGKIFSRAIDLSLQGSLVYRQTLLPLVGEAGFLRSKKTDEVVVYLIHRLTAVPLPLRGEGTKEVYQSPRQTPIYRG